MCLLPAPNDGAEALGFNSAIRLTMSHREYINVNFHFSTGMRNSSFWIPAKHRPSFQGAQFWNIQFEVEKGKNFNAYPLFQAKEK